MPQPWKKQIEPQVPPSEVERRSSESVELRTQEALRPETPRRSFDDLIVPASVRARIEAALARILYHRTLYYDWNLQQIDPDRSGVAINLYGPPGTGKTFCAEAVAARLGRKLLRINYAEIESKYVGETPKNITAAFTLARKTESVLFFDESDSILGKRLTNITQSADHGVNVSRAVMLTQLDRFSGVVIFATNLASNYDGAFIRRILAHIEFELPDEECRRQLWRKLLPKELPVAQEVDVDWLAAASGGLSGGDLLNVVVASASAAVQRAGSERRIQRTDLTEEIKAVRVAKEKIGSGKEFSSVVTRVTAVEPMTERGVPQP